MNYDTTKVASTLVCHQASIHLGEVCEVVNENFMNFSFIDFSMIGSGMWRSSSCLMLYICTVPLNVEYLKKK